MSTFQPSEHSQSDLGMWPFSDDPEPASPAASPASPAASPASGAAPGSGPKSGTYTEGGYIYNYNAVDKSIRMVMSPKGGNTISIVASGTIAYNAILSQIKSGVAAPIGTSAVATLRAAAKPSSGGGYVAKTSSGGTAASDPGLDLAVPFYQQTWFPFVVIGGVTVLGALAIWFMPSKKPAHAPA